MRLCLALGFVVLFTSLFSWGVARDCRAERERKESVPRSLDLAPLPEGARPGGGSWLDDYPVTDRQCVSCKGLTGSAYSFTCHGCRKPEELAMNVAIVVGFGGGSLLLSTMTLLFLFNHLVNPKVAQALFGGPLSSSKALGASLLLVGGTFVLLVLLQR